MCVNACVGVWAYVTVMKLKDDAGCPALSRLRQGLPLKPEVGCWPASLGNPVSTT